MLNKTKNGKLILTPKKEIPEEFYLDEEIDEEDDDPEASSEESEDKDVDQILAKEGIIIIDTSISKENLREAKKKLLQYHYDETFNGEIQIIINSPGGSCAAGWAFIDMMGFVRNPIRTIAMGDISSMGATIFVAGDTRVISENTSTMIHQFSAMTWGNYDDLIANNKQWEQEQERFIRHFIRHSKYKTRKQIEKNILLPNDHYLTPEDMLNHGLCDIIWKSKKKRKKKKK